MCDEMKAKIIISLNLTLEAFNDLLLQLPYLSVHGTKKIGIVYSWIKTFGGFQGVVENG